MNRFRKELLSGITAALLPVGTILSQSENTMLASLYEQATEASGLVVQYENDVRAIDYFYGPMTAGSSGRWGWRAANSPEQRQRLIRLNEEYLEKLAVLDFGSMSVYGQVDYVLLKRKIEASNVRLQEEGARYRQVESYFPFAQVIYDLEAKRRRGNSLDGQEVVQQLYDVLQSLRVVRRTVERREKIERNEADFAASVVEGLKARLKSV